MIGAQSALYALEAMKMTGHALSRVAPMQGSLIIYRAGYFGRSSDLLKDYHNPRGSDRAGF
jgi:hypothetical protein